MRIREMLAVVGLLTTVSGAAWGDCTNLYRTRVGSWGCGTYGEGGLSPYPLETEDYGGTTGLTVWSFQNPVETLPYVAKYAGKKFAPANAGILIVPGIPLMQAGWRFDTAAQWTARTAGTVSVTGYFEELQQAPVGAQLSILYDQTDLTASAFSNGTGYLSGPGADLTKLKPGGQATFTFQQAVAPGDTITFVVNANGYNFRADDLLGFKVHITPMQ